jgi:hypothetical protein
MNAGEEGSHAAIAAGLERVAEYRRWGMLEASGSCCIKELAGRRFLYHTAACRWAR